MWKIVLGPDTGKLVTDEDNSLVSGKLKETYDLAVEFFDKKGQLPKKPEGMETEEWFKDHFPTELAKIVSKEVAPLNRSKNPVTGEDAVSQNKKSAGSVTLAIFDREATGLLSEFNISGMITKISPNRHSRRTNAALERRLARREK